MNQVWELNGVIVCVGVDGLTTFVATEPYSRSNSNAAAVGGSNLGGQSGSASRTRGAGRGRGSGRQAGAAPGGGLGFLGVKTLAEKLELCCKDFNSKGCQWPQCKFLHKCSFVVDKAANRVCGANHSRVQNH